MPHLQSHLTVETSGQGLYEVTSAVEALAREAAFSIGLLTVFVRHTSCSLLIQENADPDVRRDLAAFFARLVPSASASSARNRIPGIVTRVLRDGVMAQVDLQAGPFRLVSLMSREAADALGLEPGVLASATVKATVVVIEQSDVKREHR